MEKRVIATSYLEQKRVLGHPLQGLDEETLEIKQITLWLVLDLLHGLVRTSA